LCCSKDIENGVGIRGKEEKKMVQNVAEVAFGLIPKEDTYECL
jgi:hypothetical protein